MNKKFFILFAAALLFVGGLLYLSFNKQTPKGNNEQTVNTEEWKTYQNEPLKFEFEYPGTMVTQERLVESSGLFDVTIGYKDDFFYDNMAELSVLFFPKTSVAYTSLENYVSSDAQKILFAGQPAYKKRSSLNEEMIFFEKDGRLYTFIFRLETRSDLSEEQERIISSFKFI